MTPIVTVYAVFASAEEAERIGLLMVEQQLAACVNILGPCRSIYRWEGKVERAEEVAALFKTAADRAPALIEAVAAMHSYDIPAVVAWPITEAAAGYADWVAEASSAAQE